MNTTNVPKHKITVTALRLNIKTRFTASVITRFTKDAVQVYNIKDADQVY